MAGILCKQCGYMNPEGVMECEICAEPLGVIAPAAPAAAPEQAQPVQCSAPPADSDPNVEYFVICPESATKTVVEGPNVGRYYCEGCQLEHDIDGMIWVVESRTLSGGAAPGQQAAAPAAQPAAPKRDELWLEEVNTRFRIDISKPGGTLGRYGDFGGDYFLSRSMHTVSGEHCLFRYEFDNWTLTHISRTNQTKYDGIILSSNEPTLLADGKMITLANTVSFIVRIG